MPKLTHKSIEGATLSVSDEVAESMKGSWNLEPEKPEPKSAKAKAKPDSK